MTYPGLGGQQPPPQNASPAGQLVPGVTPGVSQAIVIANTVIVTGPTGAVVGVFVYAAGTTPGAGNEPVASLTNQTADPFGNQTEPGVAAYVVTGGDTYAIQLGAETVASSTFPAVFITNLTSTPFQPPLIYALTPSAAGSGIELNSGIGPSSGAASGVVAQDQDSSGVPGGLVTVAAGQTAITGTLTVGGTDQTSTATGAPVTSGPNGPLASHTHFFAGHTHTL